MNRHFQHFLFFLFVLTALVLHSIPTFSQDKIIKTNNDTILSKIVEMTSDKIIFRRHGVKNGPVLNIYKNQVSKIIYENGSELEIIYDSYFVSPDLLIRAPQNAVKIDFASPLFNHITIGYERAIKVGMNFDLKAGLIAFRVSEGLDYAEGFLIKAGVKFVWTLQSIKRGLTYKHPLNGKYVKPELIYNQFDLMDQGTKISYTNYALCVNFGNQYLLWDKVTLDYYAGLGYGLQYSSYDPTSTYDRNNIDLNYVYSHFYFGKKLPLVLNGGLTVGFVF
ncbi:MAG: DUF3575 domain-containing protein [Bacteroidia bacterium]|nr:DUF3575 domain-containing protein [Bacteroidia bacterium]